MRNAVWKHRKDPAEIIDKVATELIEQGKKSGTTSSASGRNSKINSKMKGRQNTTPSKNDSKNGSGTGGSSSPSCGSGAKGLFGQVSLN